MTRVRVLVADSHVDLERQMNDLFQSHPCSNVRFLQLATEGEHAYAVLVAWEE